MIRQLLQVSALILLGQISLVSAAPDAADSDVDPIYITIEAAPVYKTVKSIVATEYVTVNGQVYASTVYSTTTAVTTGESSEPTPTLNNLPQTLSAQAAVSDSLVSDLSSSTISSPASAVQKETPSSSAMSFSLSLSSSIDVGSSSFSSSILSSVPVASTIETSSSFLPSSSSLANIVTTSIEYISSPTSSTTPDTPAPDTTPPASPTTAPSDDSSSDSNPQAQPTSLSKSSGNSVQISEIVPSAIVYSPYTNSGQCKDKRTVLSDLQLIASKNIQEVRLYATDCDSLNTVQPAASSLNIKVNQGFWMDHSGVDSIDSQVSAVLDYADANGWDIFSRIIIGNEAVLQNICTPGQLLDKARAVSGQLRDAGYDGPIMTAEPPVSFTNHPELCTSGVFDQVGINSHSYFNTEIQASQAGAFVADQLAMTKKICNIPVFVTETGYPSAGNPNGKNIPSQQSQSAAVSSLLESLNGQCTLLTTYDDMWKDPGPFNIEQHFGVIYKLA